MRRNIVLLLQQNELLRFKGSDVDILSLKVSLTLSYSRNIVFKLSYSMVAGSIFQISLSSPFVCFSLSLVPKHQWRVSKHSPVFHLSKLLNQLLYCKENCANPLNKTG